MISSRHLAQLRRDGLVSGRRQGLWVYYRLLDDLPVWVSHVLRDRAQGVAGEAPYADDRAALAAMPNRPDSACCARHDIHDNKPLRSPE